MRSDMKDMHSEMKDIRCEGDTRHKEIIGKLKVIEADLDHIWDKSVRNERDIVKLKKQIEL